MDQHDGVPLLGGREDQLGQAAAHGVEAVEDLPVLAEDARPQQRALETSCCVKLKGVCPCGLPYAAVGAKQRLLPLRGRFGMRSFARCKVIKMSVCDY